LKKIISTLGVAALAATAFAAAPAQAATKLKIAHIPKLGTIGYFQAAHKGVERACKELKAECAYKGPVEITAAAQVKEINAAVQGGFNVLIIAANDKDALVPALRAAQKKKVTVVTYDSDVAQAGRSVFVNQASSEGIGQALAKSASDLAGGSGDIVAAAKYVSGSASKGKVFVTGLGLPNDMKTYIKDGSGAQASLWDVENFGYVAVQVANSIRNGKAKVTVGSKIKSGKGDKGLKTRTVTKGAVGNEIILGPATVFTKDNVDQFNF